MFNLLTKLNEFRRFYWRTPKNLRILNNFQKSQLGKKLVGQRQQKRPSWLFFWLQETKSSYYSLTKTKFFIISFTSDWLYPTSENKDIVIALNAIGADVGFVEIKTDKGHDSFLLDVPDFLSTIKNYLNTTYLK